MNLPCLHVVPLSRSHAAELFLPLSNDALYRFIPGAPKPDVDALAEEFARLLRGSPTPNEAWLNWVLYADDKPAGTLQATVRDDKSAIIGYVIFAEFWARGIGTRGVAWLVEELFVRRDVEALWAYVDPNNIASTRLLERLRFSERAEARLRAEDDRVFVLMRDVFII